jgi:hypothetical protein
MICSDTNAGSFSCVCGKVTGAETKREDWKAIGTEIERGREDVT